jgi:hypothetical protein
VAVYIRRPGGRAEKEVPYYGCAADEEPLSDADIQMQEILDRW